MAAKGDDVLERRRRPHGPALQTVEDGLPRTARRELPSLVRATGEIAGPTDFQPPLRPFREGPARVDLLPGLVVPPRLPARAGAGIRRKVDFELQGFPAAPEASQLQRRRRDEEARERERLISPGQSTFETQ